MSVKQYMLYCEICNWKKITDGSDANDMYQYPTSPIPGGSPKLDAETQKVIQPKSKKQPKKFRCPNCGRGIIPKVLKEQIVEKKGEFDEEDRID